MYSVVLEGGSREEMEALAEQVGDAVVVRAKAIDGSAATAGVLVSITTATLLALKDLLVARLSRQQIYTVKFDGIEITARSVDEIKELVAFIAERAEQSGA